MINGNDPAFARIASSQNGTKIGPQDGLTKREYFAALAMQGLIASTDWNESAATDGHIKHCAELSVKYSDALIAELNK